MSVNDMWKAGLVLTALASVPALLAGTAYAQAPYGAPQGEMVLVAPNGDLLDYVPERGAVIISRDRLGRTVLIDNFGNVVATEVPAETYFPQVRRNRYPAEYQDAPPTDAWGNEEVTTGTIAPVERRPLDQSFPDDVTTEMTSIEPQSENLPRHDLKPTIAVKTRSRPEITALQVFLDREGMSPGVIDGKMGSNVDKSIAAWQEKTGETLDPNNTDDIIERLRFSGGLAITSYTITPGDAAGPFVAEIPEDYSQKALLPSLAYTSTIEMLAERFHMDEAYLKELNPEADFTIPGTTIKVVNPGEPMTGKVARIVADKGRKQVFAYDEFGTLISAYPASIGSSDTPSPSGLVNVERVALNPGYTYNPKINFQQGANDKVLNIPPGPNGPVGTVWMALSKPTYGIHGTPEPSKIGRTQSHGCIRLTNWDATELAKMVQPGVTVEFVD